VPGERPCAPVNARPQRCPVFRQICPKAPTPGFLWLTGLLCLAITPSLLAQQGCFVPAELMDSQTTLTLRADKQEKIKDIYDLRGHVTMSYREMRMAADSITYNDSTGDVLARGHVVFEDRGGHLEADSGHYSIRSDHGWFTNARGYLRYVGRDPGSRSPATLFVRAEQITRVDESIYGVKNGRVSSCRKEHQGLTFATGMARIEVGHEVTSHRAVFRFVGLPVFYLPFVKVSAAREPRQTGFLLPEIGQSSQKGFTLGDGFFWAINPSADLLLGLEDFSLRGLAYSGRFRARPSASSRITASFFAIDDRGAGPNRSFRASGGSFDIVGDVDDLGHGFRGVVNVDYVNSLAFRTIWASTFNTATFSEAGQAGFLTRNFDAFSLNFYASRFQDFLSAATTNEKSVVIRQAPEVWFSGVGKQFRDSPIYFSFDALADGVGRSEPDLTLPALSPRLDFFPRVVIRPRPFWGFHFTPTLGARETYYGASLKPDHSATNRLLGEFSADLRPPSFEKLLSRRFFGHRLKHVIEPDIQYWYVKAADPESILDVIRFDATDILTEDHEVEVSLTNSIFEKKDAPDHQAGGAPARDLISWTLTQKYFLDPAFGGAIRPGSEVAIDPALSLTGFAFPEGRHLSPLDSVLKIGPVSKFDAELRADIDPHGGGVLDAGITAHAATHVVDFALTDFFIKRALLLPAPIAPTIPITPLPTFHLLNLTASHGNEGRKGLTEAFRVAYNFSGRVAQDFVAEASYNFGCFALNAQFERFNLGPIRNENLLRISITMPNIGTFGSLKPSRLIQR